MTSVLNVDTIAAKDGTSAATLTKQSPAKAWTNIDMTTPTTNDSFNQSSINDIATGRFTSSLTNSLANSDYAVTASGMDPTEASTGSNRMASGTTVTASQMYIRASALDNTANDVPGSGLVAHGDLA